MRYILILLISFFTCSSIHAQEYTLIDFGSNYQSTSGQWNNPIVNTGNQEELSIQLINQDSKFTGELLTITDSFDYINDSGTTNPNTALPFSASATKDSFFGETNSFSGNLNDSGGFVLENLDSNKYYSFSIFASRMGVSDNRETEYTLIGQSTLSATLNPSNNTTNTAVILNMQPNSDGTITFDVRAGANNTNSLGFYYLGAIKMISSDATITDINESYLSLIYPNGQETWEEGKTVSIKWQSYAVTNDITIEYSSDNGNSWNAIATVSSNLKKHDWLIPSNVSNDYLVRISSGALLDVSNDSFSVINNDAVSYKIVVLGSSTSAGTGPNNINDAWVWRYTDYLTHLDTRYEIINLAIGGFTTYNILPTGTTIPSGVNQSIATNNNITKALTFNPDGIIINLPSNDANNNYASSDQIINYNLIRNTALAQNIPVWISTPQPKNFGTNAAALVIQLEILALTSSEFGAYAFDFWSDFGVSGNNGIKSEFNVDGTHLNAYGHHILFSRVVAKDIHTIVKNSVDSSLDVDSVVLIDEIIKIYPNPSHNEIYFEVLSQETSIKSINIYNANGMLIDKIHNSNKEIIKKWKPKTKIPTGVYYASIITNNKHITRKLIIN